MNKFIPQTGGHNLHLDEFVLIQNSYLEGFNALVRNISSSGNVILTGVVVDTSGVNVVNTSGYIAIAGEIYKVESGSFAKSGNPADILYFKPIQTAIAPSPIVYEDTIAKNVHYSRKAFLKYKAVGDTDGIEYDNLSVFSSVVEGAIMAWRVPAGKSITDYFTTSGLGINAMTGYAICNGDNNTLDLRGMNLPMATNVPYTGSNPLRSQLSGITNNYGDVAGNNKHVLTQAELPNVNFTVTDLGHTHPGAAVGYVNIGGAAGVKFVTASTADGGALADINTKSATTGISVASGGSSTAHETRAASYYVYYIQKIK